MNQKECRNTMFGHTNSVNHCRFSPDDKLLASCSADGTLKVRFCLLLKLVVILWFYDLVIEIGFSFSHFYRKSFFFQLPGAHLI